MLNFTRGIIIGSYIWSVIGKTYRWRHYVQRLLPAFLLPKMDKFYVSVCLFSKRSQMTSKCGKNISDTLADPRVCHFFVLRFTGTICDLVLNRCTKTWNLFVQFWFAIDGITIWNRDLRSCRAWKCDNLSLSTQCMRNLWYHRCSSWDYHDTESQVIFVWRIMDEGGVGVYEKPINRWKNYPKPKNRLYFLPKTENQMPKNWKPGNGNGHQNRKSQRPPRMAYIQSLDTKVVNIEISKVSVNQDIYDKSQHCPLTQRLNPFLNKSALILGRQKCSFLTHSSNSFQVCWILLPLSSRKQKQYQKSNHHKQTNVLSA